DMIFRCYLWSAVCSSDLVVVRRENRRGRVLEVLHQLYPDAPIFTSVYDADALPDHFRDWTIYTSFLQKLHIFRRQHQWALLLYRSAERRLANEIPLKPLR